MDLRQEFIPLPSELDFARVREWVLGLTEVERLLGPYFTRRDLRRRAWA